MTFRVKTGCMLTHWHTGHTGDTVTFMAWHTVQDALKLTGKSRSQLYRDMAKGLVSYRTGKNDRREFETSELIRVYGELRTHETPKRHNKGHPENDSIHEENPQLEAIQQKLDALQKTVTMMLEDKIARETEKRVQEEERNQLQAEISRLTDALEQEKKRGFWSRLFRSGSE
jgi:predicted ribosome quality control (RQC) complex YloA/Tae2 family protein